MAILITGVAGFIGSHLAAQAGVRYSIINPGIYLKYNIDSFLNILEYCRKYNKTNLVYTNENNSQPLTHSIFLSQHIKIQV